MNTTLFSRLADEVGARPQQVEAAVRLLDEGSTVPFVARYRKEATGGLDDVQLRKLEERLLYLRELDERRAAVLASIQEQGKLTAELRARIEGATTKVALEDLYAPYKPRRRSKAQAAREAGLEPLARALVADPTLDPTATAAAYVTTDGGVEDVDAALEGARQILMEDWALDPELVGAVRSRLQRQAVLVARVVRGKQEAGARYRDYFEHREPLARVPSHRALAMLRGRKEGVLRLQASEATDDDVAPIGDDASGHGRAAVLRRFALEDRGRPADRFLLDTARLTYQIKLSLHIETELFAALRQRAEAEAIAVFAGNLRDLLLAAPAGPRAILGLDPGLRTGVKVAVVDRTGKVLDTGTVYPHAPRNQWDQAVAALALLCQRHGVAFIAIGNGTASRETDKLAGELIQRHPDLDLQKVVVSEAGASVYSASEQGSQELPDLDVSLRGAVSIARRLQDPLAELVKIDPKSIGVGQYQHDVNQHQLLRALDAVVEDCVNGVGVDVNTASEPLLYRVAGLNPTLARNIVARRDAHGPFRSRRELLDVPRLGPKAYQQAAGFLRVPGGDDPLDASAVHPEAYPVVERIVARTQRPVDRLVGDRALLQQLRPEDFTDARFGVPTVADILAELEKPGRDPRPELVTARFRDDVQELTDLQPGMTLEGVVSNVTNFGAFVDLGVHQDGLVHISQLADRFVEDPREVVKPGDVVTVRVLEVDLARRRVALTMRRQEPAAAARPDPDQQAAAQQATAQQAAARQPAGKPTAAKRRPEPPPPLSPLAAQLAKLKDKLR